MTMTVGRSAQQRQQYLRDSVLSATPARLLTMLYDRLLLDLQRAQTAQEAENWAAASPQLIHAQEIVTELSASLKIDAWDGAENLLGIYNYVANAMVNSNIHRNVNTTKECIALLEPLRQSWHEAAAAVPAQGARPASLGGLGVA